MSIVQSGETCNVSGLYKAHCVHAKEHLFFAGQKLPRCERCSFDILWVMIPRLFSFLPSPGLGVGSQPLAN